MTMEIKMNYSVNLTSREQDLLLLSLASYIKETRELMQRLDEYGTLSQFSRDEYMKDINSLIALKRIFSESGQLNFEEQADPEDELLF